MVLCRLREYVWPMHHRKFVLASEGSLSQQMFIQRTRSHFGADAYNTELLSLAHVGGINWKRCGLFCNGSQHPYQNDGPLFHRSSTFGPEHSYHRGGPVFWCIHFGRRRTLIATLDPSNGVLSLFDAGAPLNHPQFHWVTSSPLFPPLHSHHGASYPLLGFHIVL